MPAMIACAPAKTGPFAIARLLLVTLDGLAPVSSYVTRPLSPDTLGDFAHLVEANKGSGAGCWVHGFHPEGVGKRHTVAGNRLAKRAQRSKRNGAPDSGFTTAMKCVGWCQFERR